MLVGLCVLFMQALQTPPLATLVRTEGGINPSEEKLVFFEDGTVLWEFWSLAQRERQLLEGHLDGRQVQELKELLVRAEEARWPATLNAAQGAQVAFAVTLRWRWQGRENNVTGYPFGQPPLPEAFENITQALVDLARRALPSPKVR